MKKQPTNQLKKQKLHYNTDIVIFGGGIAGLWLLNRVRDAGYQAILIEKDVLGGVQTLASQGMIHGGQKYTLTGKASKQAVNIAAMPKIWADCFSGIGEIDLSSANILSDHQIMWANKGFMSKAGVFAASKAVNAETTILKDAELPKILAGYSAYKMNESVLDIKSLISVLVKKYQDYIYQGDVSSITQNKKNVSLTVNKQNIEAKSVVFTAGSGNEKALEYLGVTTKKTQKRPLKQVMAKGLEETIYGHCIVANPKPRATITSHPYAGKYVWYMGGSIAEKSVDLSDDEAMRFAKNEMQDIFPKINWDNVEWAVWSGDRAEPYSENGRLPEGSYFMKYDRVLVAWPTKLTFAPALSNNILEWLNNNITKSVDENKLDLSKAEIGTYPWEDLGENTKWQKI